MNVRQSNIRRAFCVYPCITEKRKAASRRYNLLNMQFLHDVVKVHVDRKLTHRSRRTSEHDEHSDYREKLRHGCKTLSDARSVEL